VAQIATQDFRSRRNFSQHTIRNYVHTTEGGGQSVHPALAVPERKPAEPKAARLGSGAGKGEWRGWRAASRSVNANRWPNP